MALALLYFDFVRSDRQGRKQGGAGYPIGGLVAFFIFAELVKNIKIKIAKWSKNQRQPETPSLFSAQVSPPERLCGTPGIFPVLARSM
jgi:hypothetical protein